MAANAKNERLLTMAGLLRANERLQVRELAVQFGVSEMTVRRDMLALEGQGLLVRTYGGGAASTHSPSSGNLLPHAPSSPERAAIGRLAAGLVQSGQTVMVDTGTTALEVARHLPDDPGVTIATTSLGVALELYHSRLNLLLLGGFLHKEFPSLYGPLTEHNLNILHVDMLFIGCNGADSAGGFYASDMQLLTQIQAMMRIATRIVVVTESRKFGRKSFVRYARPAEIHTLVTDAGLPPQDRQVLEEQGVSVLIAGDGG
jgi:DeoR/GlpR family transcriptional regulator of sugar metabolism